MAFKGTARRSALQIAEAIEDVGGYINAYTSREVTAYYARVLQADTALALDVIADILMEPALDPREIEVERHVILQEIGQANDTPDDIIFDWLQEKAYPGQALGRTILGPAERVQAFSREDLARFVDEHYGPDQLIVAAAGAVDHAALVMQAERLFGHLVPRDGLRGGWRALCRRRAPQGQEARAGASCPRLRGARLPRSRLLHRAGLRHRAWRRHVLASFPGDSREAGPLLHDLRAGRAPMPIPA